MSEVLFGKGVFSTLQNSLYNKVQWTDFCFMYLEPNGSEKFEASMIVDLYIDVPYNYRHRVGAKYASNTQDSDSRLLMKEEGFNSANFIRNHYSGLSKGEIYKVTMPEKDATIFVLKGKFDVIPASIVEKYIEDTRDYST